MKLSDIENELLNSNLNAAVRINKQNKEIEELKARPARAVEVIEDFDLLSLHAPFCRFPVEECSDQCMNKEYYNLNNLTKRARQFLATIKEKE